MGQQDTLVHRLAEWAERQPDAPAIHEKKVDGSSSFPMPREALLAYQEKGK